METGMIVRVGVLSVVSVLALEWGVREFATFLRVYGTPWNRRAGTNGRWRTDLLVSVMLITMGGICLIAVSGLWLGGWSVHHHLMTGSLTVFAGVLTALRHSAHVERASVRSHTHAERSLERTAQATERTAQATEQLADVAVREAIDRLRQETADARDVAADARDVAADARDIAASVRDDQAGR